MPRLIQLGQDAFTISIALPAWPKAVDGKEADDEAAPKWNLLLPEGKVKYRVDFPNGLGFGRSTLERMVANFEKARGRYMGEAGFGLPVTFTHVGNSQPGNLRPVEDRRAAGWIEALELRVDGLWGLMRWTKEARQRIRADEFRFLSPEFILAYMDPDTGVNQGPTLFGASLVNDPFLYELPRVAASRGGSPKGDTAVDKAKLCSMLGLSPETSDEELEKTLAARLAVHEAGAPAPHPGQAAMAQALEEGKLALARTAEEKASLLKELEEARAQVKAAAEAEAQAKRAAVETEAKAFCASLVQAGKLVPAKAEKLVAFAVTHGLSQLQELYDAGSPPVVDLKERGVEGGAPASKDEARKAFNAEVDKLIQGGASPDVAYRRVRLAQPDLAKQVFG